MNRYIILLRGINVGGKNKINMIELKRLFEDVGYMEVITYINSGNVILSSKDNEFEIKKKCEEAIQNKFNLIIPVFVISDDKLSLALKNVPSWWNHDEQSKHNVIFVLPPFTSKEIIKHIGQINPLFDQIYCFENIIFWSSSIALYSKTKWSKLASLSLYKNMTIRNANTTMKLLELIEIEKNNL